jgi:hypothetical protein
LQILPLQLDQILQTLHYESESSNKILILLIFCSLKKAELPNTGLKPFIEVMTCKDLQFKHKWHR